MIKTTDFGRIVILNGVPRSGKSSIVAEIQKDQRSPWMNLGVDVFKEHVTPEQFGPGLGLRPGADRGDLETFVPKFFAALYESIAAHSRVGLNVIVDIGHHENYSKPLHVLENCAKILSELPAMLVGVRCPIEIIMERRNKGQAGRDGVYATGSDSDPIPKSVKIWQAEVHSPGIYDMEVDTSFNSPEECASIIKTRVENGQPFIALRQLCKLVNSRESCK